MPTFRLNGILVHFAAHKNHIGFYPTPSAIIEFSKELNNYEFSKGSIKFPINEPIPLNLIKRIVEFRVKENTIKQISEYYHLQFELVKSTFRFLMSIYFRNVTRNKGFEVSLFFSYLKSCIVFHVFQNYFKTFQTSDFFAF